MSVAPNTIGNNTGTTTSGSGGGANQQGPTNLQNQTNHAAQSSLQQQQQRSPGGSTAVTVTPANPQNTIAGRASGIGSMQQRDNPRVYTFTKEVTFQGKKYKLTLEMPTEKDRNEMDVNELETAAGEFADVFLADLKSQVKGPSSQIKPGDSFHVLFHDEGWIAFKDKSEDGGEFDPYCDNVDTITQRYPHVNGNTEASKQLTATIKAGTPEKISNHLKDSKLNSLRETLTTEKAVSFLPVNLVNQGVRCFINSAFQQLVTNKAIHKDIKPEYFLDGEKNGLYKALKGYLKHQESGETKPYDLGKLIEALELNEAEQNDVGVAWNAFANELNLEKIPQESLLRSLLTSIVTILPDESMDPGALIQGAIQHEEAVEDSEWSKNSSPSTFSVYVNRGLSTAIPLTQLPDTRKAQFIQFLQAHDTNHAADLQKFNQFLKSISYPLINDPIVDSEIEKACQAIQTHLKNSSTDQTKQIQIHADIGKRLRHLAALKTKLHIQDFNTADATKLADDVFNAGDQWSSILTNTEKADIQKDRTQIATKTETSLNIDQSLAIKLPQQDGTERVCDVTSFSLHTGEGTQKGHYVTYVRDGKDFWKLDDLSQVPREKSSYAEFYKHVNSASLLVLNKKGEGAAAVEPGSNIEERSAQIEGTLTTLSEESGKLSLAGADFALVNPTDALVDMIHSDIDTPALREQITAERTRLGAEKWISKNKHTLSTGRRFALNSNPDVMRTKGANDGDPTVFHVAVRTQEKISDPKALITDAVTATLTQAQKEGCIKVAFPIIELPDVPKEEAMKTMKEAITAYAQKHKADTNHPIRHVKIVTPPAQKALNKTIPKIPTAPLPKKEAVDPVQMIQLGPHTLQIEKTEDKWKGTSTAQAELAKYEKALKDEWFPNVRRFYEQFKYDKLVCDFTQPWGGGISDKATRCVTLPLGNELDPKLMLEVFRNSLTQVFAPMMLPITITLKVPSNVDTTIFSSTPTPPAATKPTGLMSKLWNGLTSIGEILATG